MALRWKKNPKPTGLARVGAGPQGSKLRTAEGEEVAWVYAHHGHSPTYAEKGWYWVVATNTKFGIPYYNSCHEPGAKTEDEAKAAASAYVKQFIK